MLIYAFITGMRMAETKEVAQGLAVLIPGTLGLTYSTIPKAVTGDFTLDAFSILVDVVSIGLFVIGLKLTSQALSD